MILAPWAADYIGIPFQTGGSARDGCDCWGLLALAYREVFGITLPVYSEHYNSLNRDVLAGVVDAHLPTSGWQRVHLASMRVGDGLLFRVVGQPIHVGLFVGAGRFLHTISPSDSCVERLEAPRWARRLTAVYRYGG